MPGDFDCRLSVTVPTQTPDLDAVVASLREWVAVDVLTELAEKLLIDAADLLVKQEQQLQTVRRIHRKITVQIRANDGSLTPRETCSSCTGVDDGETLSPNEVYRWPCSTARAVAVLEGNR